MARQRLFDFPEGVDPSSPEGMAFKYRARREQGYYKNRKSTHSKPAKPLVLISGDRASLELRDLLAYSCFIRIGEQEWDKDETIFPNAEMLEVMAKRLSSYYKAAYQREYRAKRSELKQAELKQEQESNLVWRGIHFD